MSFICLLSEVAVIHCQGHKKEIDEVLQGNLFPDMVAKATAQEPFCQDFCFRKNPLGDVVANYTGAEMKWVLLLQGYQFFPFG